MKVVGLITEYNPFHNGHKYHLEEAKKRTGADYVVVVMSGNFVQRGTPALMDKYTRTKMALSSGADLVLELPTCYASSSAEFFSLGAISLLHKLGIVDELCFGSECGDIDALTSIARFLLHEPHEFKKILNEKLKEGSTYPEARMDALIHCLGNHIEPIVSSPNNILGIEYIKALITLNSNIKPVTIKRITASYHSQSLTNEPMNTFTISSATAIRKALKDNKELLTIKEHVPSYVYETMLQKNNISFPIFEDDFYLLLQYKLMMETNISLTKYTDVTLELANRIKGMSMQMKPYHEFALDIKTKQITLTRINRALLHILLGIIDDEFKEFNSLGYTNYARILGFKKSSSHLIRQIVDKEQIPVITKVADAHKYLSATSMRMLEKDIFCSHLYNHVIYQKYGTKIKDEYTMGVIMEH